jgi:hypothetical protein
MSIIQSGGGGAARRLKEKPLLSNSRRRVGGIELGKSLDIFQGFVVHSDEYILSRGF